MLLCLSSSHAADVSDLNPGKTNSNRISVAVFRFENAGGDPALDHWGFTTDMIFRNCLHEIRQLRILPDATQDYGLRKLNIKSGDSISVTQARQLGEIIEAQRVVCGSYRREGANWQLSLRVLNVSTGEQTTNLTALAADWFELRDNLAEPLLKALGVTWTTGERERLLRQWTKSPAALESLLRGRALYKERRPASDWEDCARQAVQADPDCADAYILLAASLGAEGKFAAARTALAKAVKLGPDLPRAQLGLGNLALLTDRPDEATAPLKAAARLDPDNADTFARLAEVAMLGKNLPAAEENFKRALELSPFQAGLYANLARVYIMQGKREPAQRALETADHLVAENDINAEDHLAWSYARLDNGPAAIAHYEKLLVAARKIGLNSKRVDAFDKELRKLKAAQKPEWLKGTAPKEYTEQALKDALRANLTAEELELAVNPLAANPQMALRAKELTTGASSNTQKARMLFDGLSGHLDAGEDSTRTAAEVFAAWNGPATDFRCQEYARLYVAMARAVGLHAFFVDVAEAYDGEKVSHNCAAIFEGEKLLLVDPTYQWFGIPHRKYQVFNDVQATADYLAQTHDVRRAQIAIKLDPASGIARYNLAATLLLAQKLEEAREQLTALEKLDPDGPLTDGLRAMLALHDKKYAEAADFARKGLPAWPRGDGNLHFILGTACLRQGQLRDARDAYRTALLRSLNDEPAQTARRAIANINAQIGTDD